jgi:hypothetical protein
VIAEVGKETKKDDNKKIGPLKIYPSTVSGIKRQEKFTRSGQCLKGTGS